MRSVSYCPRPFSRPSPVDATFLNRSRSMRKSVWPRAAVNGYFRTPSFGWFSQANRVEKQIRNDLRGAQPGAGEAAERGRRRRDVGRRRDTQISVRSRDRRRPGHGRGPVPDRPDQRHVVVGWAVCQRVRAVRAGEWRPVVFHARRFTAVRSTWNLPAVFMVAKHVGLEEKNE